MYRTLIDVILFVILIQISQIGFLGYLFIREISDIFIRYRRAGNVTTNGIKRKNDSRVIPFEEIMSIEAGYERSLFLSNTIMVEVSSDVGLTEICLTDEELSKLAKTGWNDWSISTMWDMDTKLVVVTPGLPGKGISIFYKEVGRYAPSPYLISILGIPIFGITILGLFLSLFDAIGFIVIMAIFAVMCFGPVFYQRVLVRLNDKGVLLREGDNERFLPFTDVVKVDKGLFRVKVAAKSGEIFYFPKACYLLAEFIKTFTKEGNERLETSAT